MKQVCLIIISFPLHQNQTCVYEQFLSPSMSQERQNEYIYIF